MNAVLDDWPTLDVEPIPEVIEAAKPVETMPALQSLREHSLAELSAVERGLAKLKQEHGSTDYDVTTPHGYKLATARRHAVRLVRYAVPKVVKAKRAELNEIRDAVASEGDRIIAALLEIEQPHDDLITDEDARRKAEQAEKARVEQERKDRHEAAIAMIRSYATRCEGLPSERISSGITQLENQVIGDGFQEYLERATEAKAETLATMHTLYEKAKAREAEQARLEAQRIENERVAAEQAAERARLEAEAAELKAQRKRFEEAAAAIDAKRAEDARVAVQVMGAAFAASTNAAMAVPEAVPEVVMRPLYAPLREVIPEAPEPQQVLKATAATPDATDRGTPAHVIGGSASVEQPAAAGHTPAEPVAWHVESDSPDAAGWYAVRRADGSLCLRAFGKDGQWWIPLPDGWLSGLSPGFSWFGPLEEIEWDTPRDDSKDSEQTTTTKETT